MRQLNPVHTAAAAPRALRMAAPAGVVVLCSRQGFPVRASAIPTPDEDAEVMHDAFMKAFSATKPQSLRIRGMQELAGSVRRRGSEGAVAAAPPQGAAPASPPHPAPSAAPPAAQILARQRIPSQQYSDPLAHIFSEFDRDGDGFLTAHEVAAALRSRDVEISDEQAALFVDAVNPEHRVPRAAWRDLLLHMAAADLHSSRVEAGVEQVSQGGSEGEGKGSSLAARACSRGTCLLVGLRLQLTAPCRSPAAPTPLRRPAATPRRRTRGCSAAGRATRRCRSG